MKVFYLNNQGEGFQRQKEVPEGTTVSAFVASQTQNVNFDDYTIRVNNHQACADDVLTEGDRISVIPKNVKGA